MSHAKPGTPEGQCGRCQKPRYAAVLASLLACPDPGCATPRSPCHPLVQGLASPHSALTPCAHEKAQGRLRNGNVTARS